MESGIDLARPHALEHAALIEKLKEQLLIVFLKRLGGTLDLSIKEVDDTGQDLFFLAMIRLLTPTRYRA